jgi:choline-sulfatase
MLFDLAADPHERTDLAPDPSRAPLVAECEKKLRELLDPEAVDRLARADQRTHIELNGGKEAILKKGTFRYSPPPGSTAKFY